MFNLRIRALILLFTLFGVKISFYSQNGNYETLQEKYKLFRNKNKLDSALIFAKQMNSWAFINEGDTSLRYAVSFRYIGNCFLSSDSALYYFDLSLQLLKKQKREVHPDYARSLYNIGKMDYQKADYISAELCYKKAMEIFKKSLGEEHPDYVRSIDNLGILYSDMGDYNSAEPYYEQVMKIKKKVFGDQHPEYAQSLNNLGVLYLDQGKYHSAEPYFKKALEIRQRVLGDEHTASATSLTYLGILYSEMGDYNSAEHYFNHALSIYKKSSSMDDPDYALVLNNLGLLNTNKSDYNSAENYFLQSLELTKKVFGEDHINYAMSLNNLGILYSTIGDYKYAETYYKKALDVYKKALGEESKDYASNMNNLGVLYLDMGDYYSAELYYKQAVEIFKKSLGEEHPDYAGSLNNLGNLYSAMGDYRSAEYYYKKAFEIYKKVLYEEHPAYASIFTSFGNLYSNIGDYKSAENYYKQALEIRKKVLGDENIEYAWSLNNLGAVYSEIGDYKSAELYYKQALEIRKRVLGKGHSDYATSLSNLGILYSNMGNIESAITYLKKTLKIRKKVLGIAHPDYMWSLNNLGFYYSQKGDYKHAESYYKRAIGVYKKILGVAHLDFTCILNNIGILFSERGDYTSAEPYFKQAFYDQTRHLRTNFIWLSSKEKETFWNKEGSFNFILLEFADKSQFNLPSSTELCYDANVISKSLLLETSREVDQAISNSSDQLLKAQYNEMKQLKRLVSTMQSEGSDKKEIIDRYNSQADSLDKILVNKIGEYSNAKRKFEITWKDVQASLSSTDAAIEFARYYDDKENIYKYMALVVRPEFEYPKLIKLGSELNIKNSSSQKEFSELYNYVWRGIDSLLTGVKTIYYSPVGELNNVSFSALMSETNNQSDSTKSNWSYLIDRYDLHQVTTTRYLADGTLKRNETLPLSIKLIGGVNYSDFPTIKDSVQRTESTEDFALQINLQNELIDNKSNRGGKISYLKGSEIEVKEIAKTLKNSGWVTTISDGKNAGEYQFKEELNEKSPGIIHIATHGFAFPEKVTKEENGLQMKETSNYKVSEDPMVRCGLMLSGANVSWSGDSKKMIETTGDDGILTAAEVANLDLSNTKLVVLSACETGLGKIESSEGTFGLKRGFKLAGVDQMIVSLWKVPDNETMELMTLFYSDLAKTNNPEVSFNFAQKAMRNKFPYEPEKWAGFVFVR